MKKMGDAARNIAIEKFYPDKIVPQYKLLYKRVLEEQ